MYTNKHCTHFESSALYWRELCMTSIWAWWRLKKSLFMTLSKFSNGLVNGVHFQVPVYVSISVILGGIKCVILKSLDYFYVVLFNTVPQLDVICQHGLQNLFVQSTLFYIDSFSDAAYSSMLYIVYANNDISVLFIYQIRMGTLSFIQFNSLLLSQITVNCIYWCLQFFTGNKIILCRPVLLLSV